MTDLKTAQDMMAAALAANKEAEDPEVASVRQFLKLLDKAAENVRTFGHSNPVAQRFFQQFHEALTEHLKTYAVLPLLVQRSELMFQDETVYGSSSDPSTENLAFKLYSDGIRELSFHDGIQEDDVRFFLDALWGTNDPGANEDDDIVTRLWERNLSTLTLVTANEVIQQGDLDAALRPQQDTSLNAPPSALRQVVAREQTKEPEPARSSGLKSGVIGFDVSEEDLATLAGEIRAESNRDNVAYLLEVLAAILASEQSPEVLSKLFEVFEGVIDSLILHGQWSVLEHLFCILLEAETVRPNLSESQKGQLRTIVGNLGNPERIRAIEQYLLNREKPNLEGLPTILAMMPATSAGALCGLLGSVKQTAQQSIVAEALFTVAKDQPEPVLRALTDRRPTLVRHVLTVIARWNNPQHADAVEKILRYPDAGIRREVLRTLAVLRPQGNGARLVPLLNDADEGVRLAALQLLVTGNYTAPYALWQPLVSGEGFGDRPPAERRNIFHAMRATARDEAVPYWTELLVDWGWTNKKKREESALLAVDALAKLATPAALAALQTGEDKGGSAAVKQACAGARASLAKPHAKAS